MGLGQGNTLRNSQVEQLGNRVPACLCVRVLMFRIIAGQHNNNNNYYYYYHYYCGAALVLSENLADAPAALEQLVQAAKICESDEAPSSLELGGVKTNMANL